jgi:hypothetical protein
MGVCRSAGLRNAGDFVAGSVQEDGSGRVWTLAIVLPYKIPWYRRTAQKIPVSAANSRGLGYQTQQLKPRNDQATSKVPCLRTNSAFWLAVCTILGLCAGTIIGRAQGRPRTPANIGLGCRALIGVFMQVPGFELNIHIVGHEALQNIFFCFSSVVNTANTSSSSVIIFSNQTQRDPM